MKKILIVDDEKNFRTVLGRTIQDAGFDGVTVTEAENGDDAVAFVKKEQPNVVLLDIQMPGTSGLEAFQKMKDAQPKLLVIMMTGAGTTDTAIESMKLGAFDYLTKPFETARIKDVIRKALDAEALMEETVTFSEAAEQTKLATRTIVGMSQPMQDIYKTIGQVAGSNVPVLITGESGTGKELVARALYNYSSRKNRPFLVINCSAIPDTLLESELFGYEKGAFTGAAERRIGKFEQCQGGTIFLDEIGDMAGATQAKILRVLQEGEFERIGGTETIKADVRVISATNRDLLDFIKTGKFREDLYYRLNVVNIHIPPLRERKEDVPDLVKYFLRRFNGEFHKSITDIPQKTMEYLKNFNWPGNVRQLENTIKRAIVMTVGSTLTVEASILEAPTSVVLDEGRLEDEASVPFSEYLDSVLKELLQKTVSLPEGDVNRQDLLTRIEEVLIKRTLPAFNGNQVKTAKLLGITRNTLRARMADFGLR
jgi:two-component system response regulator AtoC